MTLRGPGSGKPGAKSSTGGAFGLPDDGSTNDLEQSVSVVVSVRLPACLPEVCHSILPAASHKDKLKLLLGYT